MKKFFRYRWEPVVIAIIGGIVFGYCYLNREDPRATSDKSGYYMPTISLRGIAQAMHAYQEKNGRLPPAALCDKDGKPMLSWRVLLLPYLEQEDLYRQFKLDEPWDSKHNIALLSKMPGTFAPLPGNPPLEPFTTPFQVFVGKGTPFEGCQGWRLYKDIPATSCTVLIVDAQKAVPWTKPEDIVFDENEPLPRFGRFREGRFYYAMADGSAGTYGSKNFDESTIRSAILRNADCKFPWGE